MNENTRIVVLLSTYNGEKYLKEQLDSLFAQTYKDFEILARDDGSSDDTVEILSSYNVKVLNTGENLLFLFFAIISLWNYKNEKIKLILLPS